MSTRDYAKLWIAAQDMYVPGMLARRLVQLGPKKQLLRRILKARPSDDAALSVDLLLHELAGEGELACLLYWNEQTHGAVRLKPDSFATAALNGHTDIVEWMLRAHPAAAVVTPALIKQVATLDHRGVVELLQKHTSAMQDVEFPGEVGEERAVVSLASRPVVSDVATRVFLNSALRLLISSFQPRPRHDIKVLELNYQEDTKKEDVRGLLMRLALTQTDLVVVKQVYIAAEATRFAGPPKLSLSTAMHDAAVEGRLDALEWLRVQPGVPRCRPHTMASVVRTGRSDVVRWLHANAPESTLTMSASPLVDAARWGLLDVLETCHELQIPDAMVEPDERKAWRQAALDIAIIHGHASLVRWLVREFQLIGSTDAITQTFANGNLDVLRVLQETKGMTPHSVDVASLAIAETPALSGLVDFVVVHRLLSDTGSQQVVNKVLKRVCSESAISTLLKFLVYNAPSAETMVVAAVRVENERALKMVLTHSALSPASLIQAFQVAVTERCTKALPILVSHQVLHPVSGGGVLPLLASYGELSFVQRVFANRTRDDAVSALEKASTFEIASFLLRNEDKFYTEAILLEKIPSCLSASFVRYVLKHGRCQDTNRIDTFTRVLEEDASPLSVSELNTVRHLRDPAIDAVVRRCFESLVVIDTTTTDHAAEPWSGILEYLCTIGVQLPSSLLDAAITRGRLEEVEWLVRVCGVRIEGVTASCVRSAASKTSHSVILEYLHHHDTLKRSHGLRLGIRLAYDDALVANDATCVARLENLDACDLSPLQLELVADEGYANLAKVLAQNATDEAVECALVRSTERGCGGVVVALLDARPKIRMEMALRIRLAGVAFTAGNFQIAKKLVDRDPAMKKRKATRWAPGREKKKERLGL